jgi:hypothetical protein
MASGQSVQIAKFYAQKSSFPARKMLVPSELLADDFYMARENAGHFDQRSMVHLAVGWRHRVEEVRRHVRR